MGESTIVSLHRWFDLDHAGETLQKCLADLAGIERYVRPGQTVLIKPNVVSAARPVRAARRTSSWWRN